MDFLSFLRPSTQGIIFLDFELKVEKLSVWPSDPTGIHLHVFFFRGGAGQAGNHGSLIGL